MVKETFEILKKTQDSIGIPIMYNILPFEHFSFDEYQKKQHET